MLRKWFNCLTLRLRGPLVGPAVDLTQNSLYFATSIKICYSANENVVSLRKGQDYLIVATQLLYSVNPFLKLVIQEQFRNDIHYAWCRALSGFVQSELYVARLYCILADATRY